MVKSVYIPREKKSKEKPIENLDFAKILSDAKQLTECDDLVKEKETEENQHLIEILTKIDNLTNWDLWKKDIVSIFQSFWKNFKEKVKEKLTIEQMENIKNEIEYLINNSTFEDKETEIQMDNMYAALWMFLNPTTWNEKNEEISPIDNTNIDTKVEEAKAVEVKEDTANVNKELEAPKEVVEQTENNEKIEEEPLVDTVPEIKAETKEEIKEETPEAPADDTDEGQVEKTEYLDDEVDEKDEEIESENIEEVEENEEVEDVSEVVNENTSDETDKNTKESTKIDMSKNIESLGKYISDKEFPWKIFIQSIINEKDKAKKTEKIKLLQLQLVPYYEWQIDWLINQELLTAIEKYITKNLNKKWETILKSSSSSLIRYGQDWNITNNANLLNTVIKRIWDKSMWHVYFLDYQDFEYTIENKTTITTTIDNWNYFYDIQTGTLYKQNWDDPVQDITHDDMLQKHFKIIAIAINK